MPVRLWRTPLGRQRLQRANMHMRVTPAAQTAVDLKNTQRVGRSPGDEIELWTWGKTMFLASG